MKQIVTRDIVEIDADKCIGCGLCVNACQEGAIQMIDGKATLVRDDYCDGLGHFLPSCPTDAIRIIQREAAVFDEEAVKANMAAQPAGCPGCAPKANAPETDEEEAGSVHSRLTNWPVQLQLTTVTNPAFQGADLLVAADCAAFTYGDFHRRFMKNRVTLIGCPKLDQADYRGKLTAILAGNDIRSLTVVRMQVPCCGGLERAALGALEASGKQIPHQVVTVTTDGHILS